MARVVAIASDLMFGSRIETALTASGHEVLMAPSLSDAELGGAELLVVDLDRESADAAVGVGVPVLGYYSHTDIKAREAAEAAGVDIVAPRSRMVREMPELVSRLLGTPG